MRIVFSLLAAAVCALLTFSCASDEGFTDGNADPQRAECETKALYHCFGVNCHEFYSDDAAASSRERCADFGPGMQAGGCPAEYTQCCISIEGYDGYPNGTCRTANTATFKANCVTETSSDPKKWCGE